MPNILAGSVALADAERIEQQPRKRSDLAVRSASAAVMIAVAGAAFWLGGLVLTGFIVAVGLGILAEWTMLVLAFEKGIVGRAIWLLAGVGYIGLACLSAVPPVMPPFVLLAQLAREFSAEIAVVGDEALLPDLRAALAGSGIEAAGGAPALIDAARRPADLTVAAIVGCAGLAPTMAAIEQGRTVALANKEALVSAGGVMTRAVARHGTTLLPVDSEHNAIFQCLAGNDVAHVRWVTLTASGGPFRDWSTDRLHLATPAEAVRHPNWSMGAKISVDSATMMNKGLEFIEAYHLFPVGVERLRIIVHPQSIVHSMVEYRDGSTLAQLGPSDMRVPIASALAWPARMATPCEPLDLPAIGTLTCAFPPHALRAKPWLLAVQQRPCSTPRMKSLSPRSWLDRLGSPRSCNVAKTCWPLVCLRHRNRLKR